MTNGAWKNTKRLLVGNYLQGELRTLFEASFCPSGFISLPSQQQVIHSMFYSFQTEFMKIIWL